MEELKVRIENYVISNKEDLRSGYLFKVTTKFRDELLRLYDKRTGYDDMVSYILTLKYKHIV